ncbi:hypothetical protein H5202_14880 [Shewanella sp. SG41-4]|uniref:hypothetical protein n=1 Tax=Shewanella sp. SG41-4 TaxID=2760976 RepID=UPI00160367C4|nr:hypothetical protein [Shewanella sp. SG41-4]MBB1439933.1 hypothetical protein [Shewanella sp. SG41-4]
MKQNTVPAMYKGVNLTGVSNETASDLFMKIHSFSTVKTYQEKTVNRLVKCSNDITSN